MHWKHTSFLGMTLGLFFSMRYSAALNRYETQQLNNDKRVNNDKLENGV